MKSLLSLTVPAVLLLAACSDSNDSSPTAPPPAPQNSPPMISGLMDSTIEADTSAQGLPFSVSDDSTAVANLMLSASSADQMLVADGGLALVGSGADRTLEVTPQPNQVGTVELTLRAEDGMNAFTEQVIVVTIEPRQMAFGSYLRAVFAADANSEPLAVNSLEFARDGTDFNDLLR